MATEPKIPTLKDSQKPQVKVRGLQAGATLLERLKQFKKKDLAFILAGLGTLFMAPLAEHFMMSPETGDGTLQQGWKGGAGERGIFDGSGSSPYEPGTSGMAPGSAIGGGADIITPLNVRDPSALVMGPGSTQQPPTNSVMPSTPPPTAPGGHSDSDLKDALAASARGVGAAARKALLPIPKIALVGSGLRGLGIANGGSTATAGGPISSANLVSGKAAGSHSLAGVQPAAGFKGVARGQTSADNTGMDALKKAADAAGGAFNRGSAINALNAAANAAIPANTGGSFGGKGEGGTGTTDKATGGDQNKDSKSVGESLAFLKAKAMQEAQIALWAKEQEAGDNKLEALKIRNSFAESLASGIATDISGTFANCLPPMGSITTCFSGQAAAYNCDDPTNHATQTIYTTSISLYGSSGCNATNATSAGGAGGGSSNKSWFFMNGPQPGAKLFSCQNLPALTDCTSQGTQPDDPNAKSGPGSAVHDLASDGLGGMCTSVDSTINQAGMDAPGKSFLAGYKACSAKAVTLRDSLGGGTATGGCGAAAGSPQDSVTQGVQNVVTELNAAINGPMSGSVLAKTADKKDSWSPAYAKAENDFKSVQSKFTGLSGNYSDLQACVKTSDPASLPSSIKGTSGLTLPAAFSGIQQTYNKLDGVIKALGTEFQESDQVAAKDNGTLDQVIQLNVDSEGEIDSYNSAAQKASVTPLNPAPANQPPATDQTQADVGVVQNAIKNAQQPVQTLKGQLDGFIKSPSQTTAVSQDKVDPVTQQVQAAQQAQTANLQSLASKFAAIVAGTTPAPGATPTPPTTPAAPPQTPP